MVLLLDKVHNWLVERMMNRCAVGMILGASCTMPINALDLAIDFVPVPLLKSATKG